MLQTNVIKKLKDRRRAEPNRPKDRGASDLEQIRGVRRAACPAFMPAQLATLVTTVPAGAEWVRDGYRILTRIDEGEARLFSRNGNDWTPKLGRLARAAAHLPVTQAWLDGEIVALMPDGGTDFQTLQNAFDGRTHTNVYYFIFDLLYLDGYDLRRAPLLERKRLLERLIGPGGKYGPLRYSDHVQGDGEQVLRQACKQGGEGIIAKQSDAAYVAGRGRGWLKVKCGLQQEFVIGGFTEPAGTRQAFGALLLGVYDSRGALRYAGRVGTGFSEASLQALHSRMRTLEQPEAPFTPKLTGSDVRGVHWIKPELVAEVKFAEWTREALVRQASFQGLREDKPAHAVTLETPEAMTTPAPARPHAPREKRAAGRGGQRDKRNPNRK